MAKVNLKDIQSRLVKRGREAYENPQLTEELTALTPDDGDAFLFEEATFEGEVTPDNPDYVNHKNLWRNRVKSVSTSVGIPDGSLSIQWTIDGEMVVSYKA
jgi:hypothetical protein